jgi:hypothetical protein
MYNRVVNDSHDLLISVSCTIKPDEFVTLPYYRLPDSDTLFDRVNAFCGDRCMSSITTPAGTGSRTQTYINNRRIRWLARGLWVVGVIYGLVLYSAAFGTFARLLPSALAGVTVEWSAAAGRYFLLVTPGSPAARAGLQRGDWLLAVDGKPPGDANGVQPVRYVPYLSEITFTVQSRSTEPRIVELIASKPFHALTRSLVQDFGISHPVAMGIVLVMEIITVAAFWALSLMIMWHRHDDWMAMLFSLLVFWAGVRLNTVYDTAVQYPTFLPDIVITSFVSLLMLTVATFFLLFPDGRFTNRFIPLVMAAVLLWEVVGFHLLRPKGVTNGVIQFTALLVVLLLVSQRYRTRFDRVQRQQTKWVIIGLASAVFGFFAILIGWNAITGTNALNDLPFVLLVVRRVAILAAPLALAFAFFRYRLYDVDLVLNKGMVFGTLTLILIPVFGLVFLVVQAALHNVFGSEEALPGVLMAATVCGALFQPVRRGLQDVIDRRVFRLRRNLDQFAAHRPTDIQLSLPTERGALTDTMFGAYRAGNLLGRGGMGEVYLAENTKTGEAVALKILPSELALNPEFLLRFMRESQTVAGLHHPSIVRVRDAGAVSGINYIAMQYIEGIDLRTYLKQKKRLTLDEVRAIMADVAAAMDYAHRCGVVHRDIKPANIMLPKTGDVSAVLMDFGIAHIHQDGTRLTQSNIMATLDYASPEQLLSAAKIDGRADIYALGATVYQTLTGEAPFKGTAGQIVFAHIQKPPPDASALVPELPESAAKAIARAMAKKPEDRFQTAEEFVAAL